LASTSVHFQFHFVCTFLKVLRRYLLLGVSATRENICHIGKREKGENKKTTKTDGTTGIASTTGHWNKQVPHMGKTCFKNKMGL